jgi:hypothetical protein
LIRLVNAWIELGEGRTWTSFAAEIGIHRTKMSQISTKKVNISDDRAGQFEEFFDLEFGYLDYEHKSKSDPIDAEFMERVSDAVLRQLDKEKIVMDAEDFERLCNEAYDVFRASKVNNSVSVTRISELIESYKSS